MNLSSLSRAAALVAAAFPAKPAEQPKPAASREPERRPSILEHIKACSSIEELGLLRGMLANAAWEGRMNPSYKTERTWERAFWRRVYELLFAADNPTYVYNVILRWSKPEWAAESIELALQVCVQDTPNATELLHSRGIIIEGITS